MVDRLVIQPSVEAKQSSPPIGLDYRVRIMLGLGLMLELGLGLGLGFGLVLGLGYILRGRVSD